MTAIVVNHSYSYLVPDPGEEEKVVLVADSVTSWEVPGARHSPAFKSHHWDGMIRLLSKKKLQFPSGLVDIVIEAFRVNRIAYQVHDQREYPEVGEKVIELEGVQLRGYQAEAVRAAMQRKRGVISMPPASGKTEVMISLIVSLNRWRALWLTHTRELLEQTYQRFCTRLENHHVRVGKIGEGVWQPEQITVATIQSLSSKSKKKATEKLLKEVQVVVSDECHRSPASTWHTLLMSCDAPFRFGCSATALERNDGSDLYLIASTGDTIYELTVRQGKELGIFVLPRLVFVDYDPTGFTSPKGRLFGAWQDVYARGISRNDKRNDAILKVCQRCVEQQRVVLLLVRSIGHGYELEQRLLKWFDYGRHVTFIHGSDPSIARREAISALRSGVCRVLIATSILDEGADIPEVDAVIIAAGGKSAIKAIQRAGRGMRKQEGKDLVVYDFTDRFHPVLLRHSLSRRKTYESYIDAKAEDLELF